jgi:hypothetical protein
MVGRTNLKLNNTVTELTAEFQRRGKELSRDRLMLKNMDFNDPPAVEKNFQNVN